MFVSYCVENGRKKKKKKEIQLSRNVCVVEKEQ